MSKPSKQRFKLKDLQNLEAVRIHEWSLDTPKTQYTATSAHYGRQSGVALIHFAQMVGEAPMNALAVALPPASIAEGLLPNLGKVRERLDHLEREGRIEPVVLLKPERLAELGRGTNYLQKAADRVRVATNDNFSSLDFYKLPVVPAVLIEAQPHMDLEIEDVVRVTMSVSLFHALVRQMEAVESYKPEDPHDAGANE